MESLAETDEHVVPADGACDGLLLSNTRFLEGTTQYYAEVKTGSPDLKGFTRGGQVGTQAEADAANLKMLNGNVAGVRTLGQGLRVLGAIATSRGENGNDQNEQRLRCFTDLQRQRAEART
jgi:hypothetical protein